MRVISIILVLVLLPSVLHAQITRKTAIAVRTSSPPVIDGILNDIVWQKANPINDLTQYLPRFGTIQSFPTEVRILYDDYGIYIGAMMYDPHPDSILCQLGDRDPEDLNADFFGIEFDTYNNQLDGYSFIVSASGVQSDSREFDETYNAVWQSSVKINKEGWVAEIRIPYSAVRFPAKPVQTWGCQVLRSVRRYREHDLWGLTEKGVPNDMVYWGILNGIENIQAPVRLSLFPYFSFYEEHYPYNAKGISNFSNSVSGGLDLKYGIDESFTLDVTLLPDFNQVKSDNQIKNLSAFETVYPDQRPFFQEAVDLFQKGDLFYTRRIGRLPLFYYNVKYNLENDEFITRNPIQAKLINASKLSGRNRNGLAIGVFNAITDNTYATIEDSTGNKRDLLTDPMTNYNIIVFDQALKNNSSVYFTNTNVIRSKGYDDANATALGVSFYDKRNRFNFSASGAISQLFQKVEGIKYFQNTIGSKYSLLAGKVSGKFKFSIFHSVMDSSFNVNDMGLTLVNNYKASNIQIIYNQYEPFWCMRELYNTLNINYKTNYSTGKKEEADFNINSWGTFNNYLTVWAGLWYRYTEVNDYYEPRKPGRFYVLPEAQSYWAGFSSDYRKPFALDLEYDFVAAQRDKYTSHLIKVTPIIRPDDRLKFSLTISYNSAFNDPGYVTVDSGGQIIFGRRDIRIWENSYTGKYLFRNNLSLSLSMRHYWAKGEYRQYYYLLDNGYLDPEISYNDNHNFNFNAFNIDLLFNWEFAPGSNLSLAYKNAVFTEENTIIYDYYGNFTHTLRSPQTNSLSLKVLYYFDYQVLKKKRHE